MSSSRPSPKTHPEYLHGFNAGSRLAKHLLTHDPTQPLVPLCDPGDRPWTEGYRDGFNAELRD